MKHRAKTVALLISAVLALTACGGGGGADNPAAGANASWMDVAADGTSTISSVRLGTALSSLPVESLSAAEQASLVSGPPGLARLDDGGSLRAGETDVSIPRVGGVRRLVLSAP